MRHGRAIPSKQELSYSGGRASNGSALRLKRVRGAFPFLVRTRKEGTTVSVSESLAQLDHANPVIGKVVVHVLNFVLGHVAGRALFRARRASRTGMIGRGLQAFFHVAPEAALVVVGGILHQRAMRVVAGNAGDARVAVSPAAAFFQTIRNGQYCRDSDFFGQHHVPPRAVTRSAEVHRVDRLKLFRIEDERLRAIFGSLFGLNVLCSRTMARLAGDGGYQMAWIELSPGHGCGVVAGETSFSRLFFERPTGSLLQCDRNGPGQGNEIDGWGLGESMQTFKIGEHAKVQSAIFLEYIALADFLRAECPSQRLVNGLCARAEAIRKIFSRALQLVMERTDFKLLLVGGGKTGRFRGYGRSARHGGIFLHPGHVGVALGAGSWPCVFAARGRRFSGPPSGSLQPFLCAYLLLGRSRGITLRPERERG